jgi:hypothetical protein
VPAGQLEHEAALLIENLPAAQFVHEPAPADE